MDMDRAQAPTPALFVDLDALDRNIARMAKLAARHGVRLRPHAKTHKCAAVARRQIAQGAVGVCCAKVGEAEALGAQGIGDILITSPVATPAAAARVARLAGEIGRLAIVADCVEGVGLLAGAADAARPFTVLVDVDPGGHRTGVASPEAALAVARAIAASPGLTFGGVQFYTGGEQHIQRFADRSAAVAEKAAICRGVLDLLAREGLAAPVATGGGTGTHMADIAAGVLTEIQPGSYVFMDREYADCETAPGEAIFETALTVDATVISANHRGLATLDAGTKAFGDGFGVPVVLSGAVGAAYRFMGDEHGLLALPEGQRLGLGDRVSLCAPHCDPTVNLHDRLHIVRDGRVIDLWPIEARGRGD